jgi:hypothetical protein
VARKRIAKVRCMMCGLSRVLVRTGHNAAMRGDLVETGSLGLFHFGGFPLDSKPPLYFVISHGRSTDPTKKSGFEPVGEVSLEQLVKDKNWSWIADDVYDRAKEIVRRIDDARGKRGSRS